ncbi:MAG: DUF3429 family protein [Pseudomonadota bacterium]|nr:DUF3429 family protein [Pseudomonadota bacterium]
MFRALSYITICVILEVIFKYVIVILAENKTLKNFLAYAGFIPFLYCCYLILINEHSTFFNLKTLHIFKAYSFAIVVFLAGSHWGLHLSISNSLRGLLAVSSNFIVILVWLSFLIAVDKIFLLLVFVLFFMLLLIDFYLYRLRFIDVDYFRTRCFVTALVNLTVILILVKIW